MQIIYNINVNPSWQMEPSSVHFFIVVVLTIKQCVIAKIKTSLSRRYYLSIRALHPESLVNPFPKKCVMVAQRLSTFDNAKQASLIKEATGTLEVIY